MVNKPEVGEEFTIWEWVTKPKHTIKEVLIEDPYQPGSWLVKDTQDDTEIWSIEWNGMEWVVSDHQPGDLFHEW